MPIEETEVVDADDDSVIVGKNDNVEDRVCDTIAWYSRFITDTEPAFLRIRKLRIPLPWKRKTVTDEALHHFVELGACNVDQIIVCPTKAEYISMSKVLRSEEFDIEVSAALVPESQLHMWLNRYNAKLIYEPDHFVFLSKYEARYASVEESVLG